MRLSYNQDMPLLWLSLAFVCGILAGSLLHFPLWAWFGLGLSFVFLAFFERRITPRRWRRLNRIRKAARLPLSLLLAGFFLGAARIGLAQPEWTPADLAWHNDRGTARITGIVISDPEERENAQLLRLRVTQITPLEGEDWGEPLDVKGDALLRLPPCAGWRYGDHLELIGQPLTPFENEEFSYRDYLARQGIHSYITRPRVHLLHRDQGSPLIAAIYNLRRRSYTLIQQLFPMPESALLGGILLGIENDLPAPLSQDFRDTGTTHIIAISGFNIAILASLISFFFARFFRRWWVSLLATVIAIAGYTVLVGADPPVVRAAIMGGMALLGRHIGRRQAGANSLGFTAAVMCLFNPLLLWDAGFQLSFMATLGLVQFAAPLSERFASLAARWFSEETVNRLTGPVGEYFLFTIAAQLTTLPVIAAHFQRVSLSSFIVNILILPAQPLVMTLGGVAVLLGLMIQPLGQLIAYLAWGPLAYTIRIVETFASLWRGVIVLGQVPLWAVGLYYAALFFLPQLLSRWRAERRERVFLTAAIGLLLAAGVLWRGALAAPDGRMHLTVLDVPDGPAYLLQTPGGRRVLIDGSSSASQLGASLQPWIPPFDHQFDFLILASREKASLEGLPVVVERFPPQAALWSSDLPDTSARQRLFSTLQRQETSLTSLASGQRLDLGAEAVLHVLVENEEGTALFVSWERLQILLPGGVTLQTLHEKHPQSLANLSILALSPADIGSERTAAWARLNPTITVWASQEPLPAAGDNAHWLTAADHGQVRISSDGVDLYVEAQR